MDTKKCSACGEVKSITSFYKRGRQCKSCLAEKKKLKRKENKQKRLEEKQEEIDNVLEFDFESMKEDEKKEEVKQDIQIDPVFDMSGSMFSGIGEGLLKTIFEMIAKRKGEHWNIRDDEAKNIIQPMINLVSKSPLWSKMMENSDIVALFMGLGVVVVPRVLVDLNNIKDQEEHLNVSEKDEAREDKRDNRKTSEQNINEFVNEEYGNAVNY